MTGNISRNLFESMKLSNLIIIIILLFCLRDKCLCQSYDNNYKSINFTTEQDFLGPDNQDRNYTMGFEISVASSKAFERNNYFVIPWLRKQVDYLFGLKEINTDTNFIRPFISSISLLGSGFTPLDLERNTVDPADRPYGSLVVIGSSRTTAMNEDASADENTGELPTKYAISTGLFIGMLGLPIANNVQSYIHENHWFGSTRPVPQGWNNQISNGGEPTLLYNYQVITPLLTLLDNNLKTLETTFDGAVQLGYYTNFCIGLNTKMGKFDTDYWAVSNMLNNVAQNPSERSNRKLKWNFVLSARLRYVAYNALLQGQFKQSEFTLAKADVSPFIVEAFAGIDVILFNRMTISFKPIMIRTAEFKNAGRNHSWGSFGLSYNLSKL
jgi:hypothetical protein